MTIKTFEKALKERLVVPKSKLDQRKGACACLLGSDIGAYDSCEHLCKYCYVNTNKTLVEKICVIMI